MSRLIKDDLELKACHSCVTDLLTLRLKKSRLKSSNKMLKFHTTHGQENILFTDYSILKVWVFKIETAQDWYKKELTKLCCSWGLAFQEPRLKPLGEQIVIGFRDQGLMWAPQKRMAFKAFPSEGGDENIFTDSFLVSFVNVFIQRNHFHLIIITSDFRQIFV